MKPQKLFFLAVLLGCVTLAGASVLSNAAASITAPRHWTMMPMNTSLGSLDLHYSLLYWNDSGVWDPIKHEIRWVGAGGTCCGDPSYKMLKYDEAADTWVQLSTPYSGSGHAYDGNAVNPNNSLHYFGMFGDAAVKVWNGSGWSTLPSAPFSATTPSLSWFPDINGGQGGLVFLGSNGNLAWYNGSSWASLPSVSLSGYNQFSQYNPVYHGVWLGGCGSRSSYLLDTNLTTRKLADAPISMGNGSTYHTCDPAGGNFLVYQRDPGVWYELDMKSNTWSQITDMTPSFTLSNAFHVPIPEYGAILVFNHASSAKYAYLYKHTVSTSVEKKVQAKAGIHLDISPNPANSLVRILPALGEKAGAKRSVRVFDLTGRCVADLSSRVMQPEIIWNTGNLAAGIYLVRAQAGKQVIRRTVTVLK